MLENMYTEGVGENGRAGHKLIRKPNRYSHTQRYTEGKEENGRTGYRVLNHSKEFIHSHTCI